MRQDYTDRRRYARQAVSLPCRVDGLMSTAAMQVVDLSAGGCFVATLNPLPAGADVTVRAKVGGIELPLKGRVVYVKAERGFAIEFGALASDTRYLLEQFLTRAVTPS